MIRHLKLSDERNACSWILRSRGIQYRDAASGKVTRESLGDEKDIRQQWESLEEDARKIRTSKNLDIVASGTEAALAAGVGSSTGSDSTFILGSIASVTTNASAAVVVAIGSPELKATVKVEQ